MDTYIILLYHAAILRSITSCLESESPRFAEVTYMIEQYFNDTLASSFAGQNQMLTTLSAMLRRNNKTDAAMQVAKTINRQKVPVYQADLTIIQNTFMAALREVKKEIGNDFTATQPFDQGHHPADVH